MSLLISAITNVWLLCLVWTAFIIIFSYNVKMYNRWADINGHERVYVRHAWLIIVLTYFLIIGISYLHEHDTATVTSAHQQSTVSK